MKPLDPALVEDNDRQSGSIYKGDNLVFLISLPRSGSTLLQRVLAGHPTVHTVSEPWIMLHPVYALRNQGIRTDYDAALAYDALTDFLSQYPEGKAVYDDAIRRMAQTLYQRALIGTGKSLFLDKTPRYFHIIEDLHRIFPGAKFLILLRNPLAVLSSILQSWCDNKIDILEKSAHTVDLRRGPNLLIEGIERLGEDATVIFYEDLVTNPEKQARRVCRSLDIHYCPEMLDYGLHSPPKGRFGDTIGIKKHRRPVATYVDKWVGHLQAPTLSRYAQEYLSTLGEQTLRRLGYSYQELMSRLVASPAAQSSLQAEQKADRTATDRENASQESSPIIDAPLSLRVDTVPSGDPEPLISVITPSFNQGKYIEQTIQSVLAQDYPNVEHIVIDGGSTDETCDILSSYPHLNWISEKDRGQSHALNKGLRKARGEIIAWINSDDWYEQGAFRTVADFFANNPDKNVVMGNCNLVDENEVVFEVAVNSERGFEDLKKYWVGRSIPTQPAVFFRRELLDAHGLIDEKLHYAMDYDLWLRFALTSRFYHIDATVANYRFHENAKGGDQDWSKFMPEWKKVSEKYSSGADSAPFVSVVVPCFNYGQYLAEAVLSVIDQTFQDFEIIIVNDGSTDNTREVAEKLIKEFPDHRIRLLDQENSGQPAIARNNGIAVASGEYILPLDADDRLHPAALENYRKAVTGSGSVSVVAFGWLQSFGADTSLWPAGEFHPHQLLRRNQIPSSSMFHRSVWETQNGYRTNVPGFEDWDFWVGAVRIGARFCCVGQVTTYYRKTTENSLIDSAVKGHEWFTANIVGNNAEVYEDFEVAWARDYLDRHTCAPDEGEIHGAEDRFPDAAALLISSHPERYSQKEVQWARTYLTEHPIRFTKKFTNKVEGPRGRIHLPITAIIATYNEGDVIFHVIRDLVEQDIRVYLIDHHSTDNTVAQASKWLGKGLLKIEQFPEDAGIQIEKDVYAWRYILQRKEQIATEQGPGWYIHADADEFRESPWIGLNLREGIERVDREGFNAINFKIHDFKPTDDSFVPGEDVRRYLTYYDPDIHAFNRVQIKCWKYFGQEFSMWRSGGHSVEFEGRKLYPTPFILRHYPIRSQEHGIKKVFSDRKGRFDQQERAAKWHDQYDTIPNPEHNFIRNPSELRLYEREEACRQILSLPRQSDSTGEGYYGYVRPEIQAMVDEDAKKILDVGCAAGKMAVALKRKYNAEVWGIELVDDVAKVASSMLDKVICGDIGEVWQQLPDGYFDTIIFADVLEHLENPYAVLENIKTKLCTGGKVIASIPNVRHWSVLKDLLEGRWDYTDAGILDRTHLRFFTRKSVIEMFQNAGYAIQDAKATVFGDQVAPSGLIEVLSKAGLQVSSLAEDSKHYQYIVKAVPHQVIKEKQDIDPLVSIIILTCNQLEYTRQCLDSILKHTDRPCEIIFVDNGSTDDTASYLESQAEMLRAQANIRLIQNKKNLGFAAGNNLGIAAARGQYILLMNNDIVVTPGWLDRLLDCAERHPRAGIVGPVSNYVSGPQLLENVDYNTQTLEGLGDFSENLARQSAQKDRRLLRVVGFCMLIKRAVIDRIGGMDDRYGFGNFEDDDFSLRATLAGFESWMAEDCFVHHFGSRTFIGEKIDYRDSLLKNWELFKKKWGLPRKLPYDQGYRIDQLSHRTFDPQKHHIPLDKDLTAQTVFDGSAHGSSLEAYDEVQALIREGKTEAALDGLIKMVEENPEFSPAHNDLGILYYRTGDVQKSLAHFRRATRLEPNSTTYLKNLADLLCVEFKQFEESLTIYVSVLEMDPLDTETLCNTGHLCRLLGKVADAEHFYRRVLEIDPQHPEAEKCLQELAAASSQASAEKSAGNADQTAPPAGATIDSRDEPPPAGEAVQMPAVSILVLLEGSQSKLKKTLAALKNHTAMSHELLLLDSGSRKGVSQWARQQAKQHPECKVLTTESRSFTAKAVNRGIEAASGEIIVILSGDVVVFEGWLTDLLSCMSQLPNPGVIGPMANGAAGIQRIDLTGHSKNTKDQANAVHAFRERYRHRWIRCDRLAGFCMLIHRRLIERIGMFDETIDDPELVDLDFCVRASLAGSTNAIAGDVYVHRTGKSEGALSVNRANRNWPAGEPQSEAGKRMLTFLAAEKGQKAFEKGEYDTGVNIFFDGIRLSPDNGYIYYGLAECLMNAKRYSEALDVLGELPDHSDDQRRIELLAYANEGLENWNEADCLAEQALALNPDSAAATNLKGVLAHRQGLGEKAKAHYRRAMELAPGFGDPYTNLGALKWDTSPQEAIELLEKAFVFNPGSNDIADNYHTAITSVGQYARAETLFSDAARLYPYNRNIAFKTIDLLLKQDKVAAAMEAIEGAVARFGPDDGMLAAALAVRKQLDAQIEDTGQAENCTLSLCMIVKNEEKDIGRCLQSIKPAVDEMIVVDTGSGDRTKEIARVFGAKVFEMDWADDFAAARNFAIEKASGAWTIHLDADEVVSRLDHASLRKLVRRTNSSPRAYIFTTRNYTRDINQVGWQANDNRYVDEEAGSGWTPSEKVRLFPRNEHIRFEFPVHELVEPSLMRCGIPMKPCPIPVHHYGKLNQKRSIEKEEAYYAIGRRKLAEMGDDTVALHELAIQAANLGRHAEAIELWQRFVVINPDNPLAYINMGNAYCRLGDFDAMLETAEKALALDPELKEAHYNYALATLHLSRVDEAVSALEKLLEGVNDYPLARFLLAVAYSLAKRTTDSIETFKTLYRSPAGPGLANRCREFARELADRGNIDFALALLESSRNSGIHSQELQDLHETLLQPAASRGQLHAAGDPAIDRYSLQDSRSPAAFEPGSDTQAPI